MNTDLFTVTDLKRPALRYHGGKFRLAPWIIPHIPAHRIYVEVFGGGAGVLLRKTRSKIEVYNDLDSQVVNLFQLLRDPPYLDSTRAAGGKGYVHELTLECHRQLAWILSRARGKVAISGYPSSLYDGLYQGFRMVEKRVGANGQKGSVSRLERLWMNYDAPSFQ